MTPPLVLIPSSKAKAAGGEGPAYRDSSALEHGPLAKLRHEVLGALADAVDELDDRGIARLCGVAASDAGAQREQLAALGAAPTLPAHRRYTGVVHRFAELDRVEPAAGTEVGLFSGLMGVTLLDEPVPPYRLEVTGRVPALGGLGTYWRHRLGEHLRALGATRRVWDLLPGEFARLWPDTERGDVEVVTVAFERPDGRAAPAATAKVAKGQLLRILLDEPGLTPGELVAGGLLEGWRLARRDAGLVATPAS